MSNDCRMHQPCFDWRKLLAACRYSVAIMMDTEGSEIHTQELQQPIKADVSSAWHHLPWQ